VTTGGKSFYTVVFLSVFFLILFIGMVSLVTYSASLIRAFLAAAFFTVLLWLLGKLTRVVFLESQKSVENRQSNSGQMIDFSVSEPVDYNELTGKTKKDSSKNEFVPLKAKQIDPQITKIINNDPDKMAELVKKMGFDE
jgi:flagellar biosynthesis/type III secretory pathway M-ring protein FliF/YscJ